jgi:hypothetical protein
MLYALGSRAFARTDGPLSPSSADPTFGSLAG